MRSSWTILPKVPAKGFQGGDVAVFIVTYSVTMQDIFQQIAAPLKRMLLILAVSLPLAIWYFISLREVGAFLFAHLSPRLAAFTISAMGAGLGAFNGAIIGGLVMLVITMLVTYRKISDRLKDFSVTITEQVLSIHTADTRMETEWKNVRQIINNRQKLQIVVHRTPILVSCINVPKRAFSTEQEATAFAEAALGYWQNAKNDQKDGKGISQKQAEGGDI